MKKMLFIVNPRSGRVQIQSYLLDIIKDFNTADYSVNVAVTQRRAHAMEIAANADDDTDIIVCSGGDGTLNEVISGIMKSQKSIPIGYLPAGSTNDFANTLGLKTDLKEAANAIAHGTPLHIDIGNFNESDYFSYVASFGAFTSTSYNTPQAAKNTFGHMAYIFEGIKDLTNIVPYHVAVETDDNSFEGDYVFGSVTNTTSLGGIVKLNSSLVKMNDGLFEVVLIKNPENINDLNKIIIGLSTSTFDDDIFTFVKTKEISFKFDRGMDWSLDGEHKTSGKNVKISNINKAITIVK